MNFTTEIINHILSFRPTHPVAKLIQDKYKEYYNYRVPCLSPVWEPDVNCTIQRFSAPSVRYLPSYLYQWHDERCSFLEWLLYWLPNEEYLVQDFD